MNVTPLHLLTALLWAVGIAGAVWLFTTPVRRRSFIGLSMSVSLTGTAAAIGAVVGGVHTMVLPMVDELALAAIAAVAGLVGTLAAAAAARRLTRDSRSIRSAVDQLAEGRVPVTEGRRLTAQLEQTREAMRATASQLAESRRREQVLEASRRELVAWVSHDLRTPLAGLRAMAEALEDGVATDPEHYYKQISASVDRLSGMVDDLFELSRIQAGAFAATTEIIALDDLVSDCLAGLGPLAEAQGVVLAGEVAGRVQVTGNAVELNRALTNVVVNGVRHTPPGGRVRVWVGAAGAERTADAGAGVEVVVRDECGGIAAHDLPRLFDVGFRADPSRVHRDGRTGAGLGLAITRGIVEAHEGRIEVDNVDGGCRFRVRLPALL